MVGTPNPLNFKPKSQLIPCFQQGIFLHGFLIICCNSTNFFSLYTHTLELSPKNEGAPKLMQMANGSHLGPHGFGALKGLGLYIVPVKFHLD